jgi:hypothetical protein
LEELMVCKKSLARDVFYTRGEGRYHILIVNGLLLSMIECWENTYSPLELFEQVSTQPVELTRLLEPVRRGWLGCKS